MQEPRVRSSDYLRFGHLSQTSSDDAVATRKHASVCRLVCRHGAGTLVRELQVGSLRGSFGGVSASFQMSGRGSERLRLPCSGFPKS
jgi:hypothetical protein